MKKLFAFLLALMMVLSLAACGGGNEDKTPSSDNKTSQTDDSILSREDDTSATIEEEPDDAPTPDEGSDDRFTEFGLSLEEVSPDGYTSFEVVDDSKRTYHVEFTMPGTVTEDFGFAYYKAIYDLTAAISEGGTNYKKTGGSAISPEVGPMGAWEDEHSAEAHMNVWFYKHDGKLLYVQISGGIGYDNVISFTISDYT